VGTAFFAFFRGGTILIGGFWGGITGLPIWLLERGDTKAWFQV
jgi:hypothetical protein